MRLGQLLGESSPEWIAELCKHLVPGAEEVEPHMRAISVESLLRDSGFVEQVLWDHKPPVLALLSELLEARDYRAPVEALRFDVMRQTEHWCERVTKGELAARRSEFRIYRRLLVGAWANDLKIDSSERALLGILRTEVELSTVEHFLISHHEEVQPYWRTPDAFDAEVRALAGHGIVFRIGDDLVLPTEFVPRIRKALGLQIRRGSAVRLLRLMSNEDLKDALEKYGVKTSGDKGERISRIIDEMVPVATVLESASLKELQEMAAKSNAATSGAKDELITRLVGHFENGMDLETGTEEQIVVEPKLLDEQRFLNLLSPLTGHQLELMCRRHDLKHSGAKDVRIASLWASPYDERTLLRSLKNPDLSELCGHHKLDTTGSKDNMIERLLQIGSGTPIQVS